MEILIRGIWKIEKAKKSCFPFFFLFQIKINSLKSHIRHIKNTHLPMKKKET